jgi:hypothetical protein
VLGPRVDALGMACCHFSSIVGAVCAAGEGVVTELRLHWNRRA